MRTNTQKISTTTKRSVVGVVVMLNISLGLETVARELKLMDREQISSEEAVALAKRKYTSIVHAGGNIQVSSIEKYTPIRMGIRNIMNNIKIY